MIFGFMAVPRISQHRVLFWGILGALLMRGVMIAVGAELIARYHWILYVFGVFLLVTAVKMLVIREHSDPAQNIVVRWINAGGRSPTSSMASISSCAPVPSVA